MKKALIVLLTLLVTVGLVAAADDFVNGKFKTTHKITVEVYDRSNDGGSPPDNNFYTDFIKKGMLRDYNVEVTFVRVPRWTEVQVMNNLLAAGDAPDVCVTYDKPTVDTYANMGGVLDLAPYLAKYKSQLPDLWKLLGDVNIYQDKDPKAGTLWCIEGLRFLNAISNTFVREDWLKKLNLKEPTNLKEFEAMLKAFKKNASTLLGKDADKMAPFSIGVDAGYRSIGLDCSFVPEKISDAELWIKNFDDRHVMWPNYKEGIRVLNRWYNDGLIWKDFPLYPFGSKDEDNLIKAGYVGAFIHNWDYPYRDGDNGIQGMLKKTVGPDAAFIAVDCFKNDAGLYRKFLGATVSDRKIFFPITNDEPVASLMYLNWISKLENRRFLQIGEEGVTHKKTADGAVQTIAVKGEKIMNGILNIDYTITLNGLDLGNEKLNAKSLAFSYSGIEPRYIEKAYAIQRKDGRVLRVFNVGTVDSEAGQGPVEQQKRDIFLTQSIVAKTADFDKVYDAGYKDLLTILQPIADERKAKYEALYGKK